MAVVMFRWLVAILELMSPWFPTYGFVSCGPCDYLLMGVVWADVLWTVECKHRLVALSLVFVCLTIYCCRAQKMKCVCYSEER